MHKPFSIAYDSSKILKILHQSPTSTYRPCSKLEVELIANLLMLPIQSILYFQLPALFKGAIHKDINLLNVSDATTYALNLPLAGCDELVMHWYKQTNDTPSTSFVGPNNTPTPLLDVVNAELVTSVNCNAPTIVNINNWHSIDNVSTTTLGHIISLRFNKNFWLPRHGSNVRHQN